LTESLELNLLYRLFGITLHLPTIGNDF